MKTGIFITARLSSSRLKRKHLLPVKGQPIIYFLLKRIAEEFQKEFLEEQVQLLIVTSEEMENQALEIFRKDGVGVYYGSINNIPLRHLQAARAHSLDLIVSVDGDDILCSGKGMRAVRQALMRGASYAKISSLPFGMNSWGYSKEFLGISLEGHSNDILETGWGRIFDPQKLVDVDLSFPVQNEVLRFTLDYEEDYRFLAAVIEAFGDRIFTVPDEEIVDLVLEKKLYRINESIVKEYWDNFYKTQEDEKQKSFAES